VRCPHCDRSAEFHSHRAHTPTSRVGPVRSARAYYLCRSCGKGRFPFDHQAGLTARNLTPGLEQVVTLAGTGADSFEKGAEVVQEMAGLRLGESTVERTTEAAGQRLAHRMEYPEYLANGWCIGSGAVESACKTVVGQRLKLAGMRWGEDGAHAVCHLRALDRSEKGQWDAFWNRDYTPN
jgi:hypothetical protein